MPYLSLFICWHLKHFIPEVTRAILLNISMMDASNLVSEGLVRFILLIEGLLTQGSRPGRTVGESAGEVFEMGSSDWSNGIRYQIFDNRPDTEFKLQTILFEGTVRRWVRVGHLLARRVATGTQRDGHARPALNRLRRLGRLSAADTRPG